MPLNANTAPNDLDFHREGGLDSFFLKIVAIVGMTANHAAFIFASALPECACWVLTGVGGLTFPVMAFLLLEGYRHTSNIRRYAIRLLVFACISQVPYSLFLVNRPNVLFTLLVGLGILAVLDKLENRAAAWCAAIALVVASAPCDWGLLGPVMIMAGRYADSMKGRALAISLIPALSMGLPAISEMQASAAGAIPTLLYALGCAVDAPLLAAYNGKRGRPLKLFFYAYYPAHIAVLGITKLVLLP